MRTRTRTQDIQGVTDELGTLEGCAVFPPTGRSFRCAVVAQEEQPSACPRGCVPRGVVPLVGATVLDIDPVPQAVGVIAGAIAGDWASRSTWRPE